MIDAALLSAALIVSGCREVTVEERVIAFDCARVEVTGSYERCSYGNPAATRAVNDLIARRVHDSLMAFTDEDADCGELSSLPHSASGDCGKPVVHGPLVSIPCGTYWDTGAHPDANRYTLNLLFTDGSFCEAGLEDLMSSPEQTPAFYDLLSNSLLEGIQECSEAADLEPDRIEQQVSNFESITFAPDSLEVLYSHYKFGYCLSVVDIPYEELRAIFRPQLLTQR